MNLNILEQIAVWALGFGILAILLNIVLLVVLLRKEAIMGQALDNLNANLSTLNGNVNTLGGTVAAAITKLGSVTTTGEDPAAVQAAADQVAALSTAVVKANNDLANALVPATPAPTP